MLTAATLRTTCLVTTALFLLTGVTERMLSGSPVILTVAFCLPLILLLYATWSRRIRLIQWLGFVLMLDFTACVLRAFEPEYQLLRTAALLLSVFAFITLVWYIYADRKERRN